jgi:chromosome segregation ATPase
MRQAFQKIAEYRREVENLTRQVVGYRTDLADSKQAVATANRARDSAMEERNKLQQELNALQHGEKPPALIAVEKQLQASENEVVFLRHKLQESTGKFAAELSAKDARQAEVEGRQAKCEGELNDKIEELARVQKMLIQAEMDTERERKESATLEEQRTKVSMLSTALETSKRELDMKNAAVETLNKALETSRQSHDSAQRSLQSRIAELETILASTSRDKHVQELHSEIEMRKLEASMNLFYAMLNPEKLVDVPKLARNFAKDEKKLNSELQKSYNGLDLSSNLGALMKGAKWEKELADLREQLTKEKEKRAQSEESLQAKIDELAGVRESLKAFEAESERALKNYIALLQVEKDKLVMAEDDLKQSRDVEQAMIKSQQQTEEVKKSLERLLESSQEQISKLEEKVQHSEKIMKALQINAQELNQQLICVEENVKREEEKLQSKVEELAGVRQELVKTDQALKDTSAQLHEQEVAESKSSKSLQGAKEDLELLNQVVETLSKSLETARTSNDETAKKLQESHEELAVAQKALQQAEADKLSAVAKMDEEQAKSRQSHDESEKGLQAKIAELQSEIEMCKLEASMNLFYALMRPEKLVDVPKLARNFAKDEKKLNSELQKSYNGLDLSSNLETLLKGAKWEKELADLREQLTNEREKRAQSEESLQAKIDELAGVRESLKAFEAENERALKDVSAQLNERASAASELQQALETARTSNDETAKKLQESHEELAVAQKALQQAEADKLSAVAKMDEEQAKSRQSHDESEKGLQAKIAELQSEIEMCKLEASMNLFYALMRPEKLVDVPKLARNFAKDEKKLISELQKSYNGLDLSSNLETLLKGAKWEKELADLREQLTNEREKRAQSEESLQAKIDELAGVRESLKAFEAENERALKDVSAQLNERASAASELKQDLELLHQVVETLSKSLETARTSNDETAKKLQESHEELAVAQKALQQAEADKLSAVAKMDEEQAKSRQSHDESEKGLQAKIAELQSEIEMCKLEASMNLFYALMRPEKLVDVPKLARNFAKDEKKLNSELQKNYNGLDLSSNLETLLKGAKWEKELADLRERLDRMKIELREALRIVKVLEARIENEEEAVSFWRAEVQQCHQQQVVLADLASSAQEDLAQTRACSDTVTKHLAQCRSDLLVAMDRNQEFEVLQLKYTRFSNTCLLPRRFFCVRLFTHQLVR